MARKEVIFMPGMEDRPFSSAIRAGDFIFVSGTVGRVDAQGNPLEGIEAQTSQCLENIKSALQTAGASLSDVVKATVFLTNVANYAKMNEVYRSYFVKDLPTRSTIIAGLAMPDMLLEIECIAYKP